MTVAPWVVSTPRGGTTDLAFRPILDLARGVVAGYQSVAVDRGDAESSTVRPADLCELVGSALAAAPTLPPNTFLTVPLGLGPAGIGPGHDPMLWTTLQAQAGLGGVVLDISEVPDDVDAATLGRLESLRSAGALVSLGGDDAPQPTLRSIIRLRPSIVRLGRAWVEGLENSAEKRDAIELTGTMAGQLDAWVLAEGVRTPAELRTLSELGVPLAQGPLVGPARAVWQEAEPRAHRSLPVEVSTGRVRGDGILRDLLRLAYTTDDVEAARSVLPETAGFEVVVAVDEHRRPTSVLVRDVDRRWIGTDVLTVHVDTPLSETITRAMARPRSTRFAPLVCTDSAGGFLGVLHLEDLMTHAALRLDRDATPA
jgi:EAL domain-containing protein (putative c-di-GMP-specific phosphodiesterase class I)